ncbi:MAG TPA: ATP-binding protein [Candidatus Binataceae bacterium]|nr:ATP-binding protein [Candidatus Binataceae bacterium]
MSKGLNLIETRELQSRISVLEELLDAVERTVEEQSQRLERAVSQAQAATNAKSEFLSAMSHEIRTPMNAILGMAELLNETVLNCDQRKYLDVIRNNGDSLLTLINGILDLARVESGRLSLEQVNFNLEELLGQVLETLKHRALEKGLELSCDLCSDVPLWLIGDPLRLRQILVNLVGNSIKFTAQGHVRLTVERAIDSSSPGAIHFSVVDSGIGIPKERLGELFSAFTQVDSSTTRHFGGTGLGLAIVKRLAELMDGRAWVESEFGRGSTFHVTAKFNLGSGADIEPMQGSKLPHAPGTDAPSQQDFPALAQQSAIAQPLIRKCERISILLTDDSPDNRMLIRAYLKNSRFAVDEATNGLIAVEKVKARSYELVLMDVQMPVMDGLEAMQLIRQWEQSNHRPRTPIIALTASALEEDVHRSLAAGADLHLSKPIKKATLLAVLNATIDERFESVPMPDDGKARIVA